MASRRKRKSQDISEAVAPVDASVDPAEETRRTECVARIEALQAEVGEINAGASLSPRRTARPSRRRAPPARPAMAHMRPPSSARAVSAAAPARPLRPCTTAPRLPRLSFFRAGTHTEFLNKCSLFEQEKHNLLQQAEQNKQRQLDNITSLFEYEVKAAEDIFQGKLREQKERMAADWSGKIKRAEDDRDGKAVTDVERIATRQLRSKSSKSDGHGGHAPRKAGPSGAISASYNRVLAEEEVMKDMRAIHKDWKLNASKYSASSHYEVRTLAKNGQLFYKDLPPLEKGHHVSVFSEASQEELHGIITGINATEVFVKIDGGAKTRLYLKNLRNGRSRISLRDVDH
jgi:hypothetical protein